MKVDLKMTIIIIFSMVIIKNYFMSNHENFNEGTYKQLYSGFPYHKTNLDYNFTPYCHEHIRNNSLNERYCNDTPNHKKYVEDLYGTPNWIQTKYKSYFYPAYSHRIDPHYVYSPDWLHRWK